MLAVVGVEISFLIAARASAILTFLIGGIDHCGRYDTGGYGYDGVTKNHYYSRQELSECRNRRYVTVAYCGQCNNCPVDAGGNASELGVGRTTLNYVHDGAQYAYQHHHKHEVNQNLGEALAYALQQEVALIEE